MGHVQPLQTVGREMKCKFVCVCSTCDWRMVGI